MKKILLWIWQIPQHIAAGIVYLFVKNKILRKVLRGNEAVFITDTPGWGISLGDYIFLGETYNENTVKHEQGHSVQSRIFGPLYLVVIGIPSAVFNNLWDRLFHKNWKIEERQRWYYDRFPEKWADELGGATRPWRTN